MSNHKEIIQKVEPDFQKVITFLEGEIMKIRTSSISPSLVENIKVKIDENELTIRELGTISLISSGSVPPLVSHKIMQSALAFCAAKSVLSA